VARIRRQDEEKAVAAAKRRQEEDAAVARIRKQDEEARERAEGRCSEATPRTVAVDRTTALDAATLEAEDAAVLARINARAEEAAKKQAREEEAAAAMRKAGEEEAAIAAATLEAEDAAVLARINARAEEAAKKQAREEEAARLALRPALTHEHVPGTEEEEKEEEESSASTAANLRAEQEQASLRGLKTVVTNKQALLLSLRISMDARQSAVTSGVSSGSAGDRELEDGRRQSQEAESALIALAIQNAMLLEKMAAAEKKAEEAEPPGRRKRRRMPCLPCRWQWRMLPLLRLRRRPKVLQSLVCRRGGQQTKRL
jgi:hypothetical protein